MFSASVRLVWEIDPDTRTAVEYRPDAEPRHFQEADSLEGSELLPGFQFRLADLFAELDRHG